MNSKAIKRQLLAAIAMVLVAAIALGSSTYAWFVSNTQVSATSKSVTATSATPNLLIVKGGAVGSPLTTGGKTSEEITSTTATALYPSSTNDCTNWWVVNGWENDKADAYRDITSSITPTDAVTGGYVKNGQYTQGSSTLNAYQVSTYSVYTTTGTVNLDLDPVNPITVTVDTSGASDPAITGTGFKDSLRVGIVVDGVLKVVYAPTAETGTGNDKDGAAGYRTVKDASSTKAATYSVVSGTTFTNWVATDNGDGTYTNATNHLGSVSTTGAVVQVYVWLEGTDAQCLVGSADIASDDDTYTVSLNMVGATVNAT